MINAAVEGPSDEGAVRAVIIAAGHSVGRIIAKGGKPKLDRDIPKYNQAAKVAPWVVLRDSDSVCPVELRARLLSSVRDRSDRFVLRIAHAMTESWLLADRDGFSDFFKVPHGLLPRDPEAFQQPKQKLLSICEHSSSRAIRADMIRPDGQAGPLYVARINEYASTAWMVRAASEGSASLRRAVEEIRLLPG